MTDRLDLPAKTWVQVGDTEEVMTVYRRKYDFYLYQGDSAPSADIDKLKCVLVDEKKKVLGRLTQPVFAWSNDDNVITIQKD